jgi:hypothetical protein
MGKDNKPQRCLTTMEAQMVMKELHEGSSKGHRKVLDVGYWWPTMYKDVHDYCRS